MGFGFVYGLTARTVGHFSPIEAMAMSLIAFGGAAQFAAIGYVVSGLAWPAIALLTFLLNARHALYSAALAPWFRGRSLAERAVAAHLLTDESFALVRRPLPADRPLRLGGLLVSGRSSRRSSRGTSRPSPGVMLGDAIVEPKRFGIDVIFPAAMAGLMVGLLSGRREVVAAVAGAAIGVGSSLAVGPTIGIIAGGVLGPVVGLLVPASQVHEEAPSGTLASADHDGMPRTPNGPAGNDDPEAPQ